MKLKNVYGKNVFVTGVSSGIGRKTAALFVRAGCNVVGVSRNCKEEYRELENGGSLKTLKMDVTDMDSIDRVISQIDRIDIAVLSAGMGIAGPAETTPIEAAEHQMDVNYFGVLRVGSRVLAKMREQRNGLFVVIGSLAGRVPIPMQSHYSSSKYALEAYVASVRMEMKEYNVKAVIVEPGDTRTGFTDNRAIYLDEASPYYEKGRASIAVMEKDEKEGDSPENVAKLVLSLAGKKNPPVSIAVGLKGKAIMTVANILPAGIKEKIIEKKYLAKVSINK